MNNEWKLTQKQFDWLVDIIHSKGNYTPNMIRDRAVDLLKTYGHRGWYDIDGKSSLILLTQLVRESKQQRVDVDDLPF